MLCAVLIQGTRFRKLSGTMSPPDDTDRAEIYVEGKRYQVESFIRWCRKGDVVAEVSEADPTGLYDAFYVKTK
jgi:acylphosphatase